MQIQEIQLNKENDVKLTAILQPTGGEFKMYKRPAMIVCPGGGYVMTSDREAEVVAMPYLKAGYQAFVLRYTVKPDFIWPQPYNDFKDAYALICKNAEKWHIDTSKICTIGFSAGGHLAAYAAVSHDVDIAACILVYPALLQNILGLLKDDLPDIPPLVDSLTPPMFLAAARDDRTVNINNTIQMQEALRQYEIPFESHIYSYGGHAFATGDEWSKFLDICPRIPHWVEDSVEWLEETVGIITEDGIITKPHGNVCSADRGVCLSAVCSLKRILSCANDDIIKIMNPLFDVMRQKAESQNLSFEQYCENMKDFTIAEIAEKLEIPMSTVKTIHFELRNLSPDEIPNF